MSVPEALLRLRDELPNKQWASRDLAINRSVVVLTVAAWQAWVETYARTALSDIGKPNPNWLDDDEYVDLLRAIRPLLDFGAEQIKSFSTPDTAGVCRLLRLLDDDPRARWTFASVGGTRSRHDVVGRLNDWVKVRHAIAHGAAHLPPVGVLSKTSAGHGSLTHRHAVYCVEFFRQLTTATGRHD